MFLKTLSVFTENNFPWKFEHNHKHNVPVKASEHMSSLLWRLFSLITVVPFSRYLATAFSRQAKALKRLTRGNTDVFYVE